MTEDKRQCSCPETLFLGVSELTYIGKTDDEFKSVSAIDQVVVGAVTASRLGKCTHRLNRR